MIGLRSRGGPGSQRDGFCRTKAHSHHQGIRVGDECHGPSQVVDIHKA